MEAVRSVLEARQVTLYFLAILAGAAFGLAAPEARSLEGVINPALAVMLFATFLQVPLAEIAAALRNVRFMGALLIANFVVMPAISAGLIQFLPAQPMLRLGVLFVLLTPCIDYVITFTHLGKGNARLLLAMTPMLLVLQMLLLPGYLNLILGGAVSGIVTAGPFLHAFIWLIALPLALAGAVQAWMRRSDAVAKEGAMHASKCELRRSQRGPATHDSYAPPQAPLHRGAETLAGMVRALYLLPVPATAFVLFVVPASVMPQIGPAQSAALHAAPVYIAFALIAPLVGKLAASLMRLDPLSARAVSFSASYRNSLVILPLAFAVPGGVPLLPAVILTQTIVELCFLPLYVRLIPRLGSVPV